MSKTGKRETVKNNQFGKFEKKKKGYDIFKVTWKCVEFNKKERKEDKEREKERRCPRKPELKETCVPQCSLQHCFQ